MNAVKPTDKCVLYFSKKIDQSRISNIETKAENAVQISQISVQWRKKLR